MDLTSEAISKIVSISNPETYDLVDANGRPARYSSKPLVEVRAQPPAAPELFSVNTLRGFADLVRAKLEDADFTADYLIQVQSETSVSLVARKSDQWGRRQQLVYASPVDFKEFPFGQWLDQEQFAIALASQFAETEDRGYVIALASCLTNEAVTQSEDDGVTQRVVIRKGLAQKANASLKSRVVLAPYRTFPEVQQPSSEFVFRAKTENVQRPMLTLIEADGGAWKLAAIKAIRDYMEAFNLGIPVIS